MQLKEQMTVEQKQPIQTPVDLIRQWLEQGWSNDWSWEELVKDMAQHFLVDGEKLNEEEVSEGAWALRTCFKLGHKIWMHGTDREHYYHQVLEVLDYSFNKSVWKLLEPTERW